MRTVNLNSLLNKIYNAKNARAKEIRIPIEEAYGAALELATILTDNHIITFEDLKEALINSKSVMGNNQNKKITGGTF